jgi:hypothetical protein
MAPGPIDTASGDSAVDASVGALTVTTVELAADETTPDADIYLRTSWIPTAFVRRNDECQKSERAECERAHTTLNDRLACYTY